METFLSLPPELLQLAQRCVACRGDWRRATDSYRWSEENYLRQRLSAHHPGTSFDALVSAMAAFMGQKPTITDALRGGAFWGPDIRIRSSSDRWFTGFRFGAWLCLLAPIMPGDSDKGRHEYLMAWVPVWQAAEIIDANTLPKSSVRKDLGA